MANQPKGTPQTGVRGWLESLKHYGGFIRSEDALNARLRATNAKKLEGNPNRMEPKK